MFPSTRTDPVQEVKLEAHREPNLLAFTQGGRRERIKPPFWEIRDGALASRRELAIRLSRDYQKLLWLTHTFH
jgi:hypothetical protein